MRFLIQAALLLTIFLAAYNLYMLIRDKKKYGKQRKKNN